MVDVLFTDEFEGWWDGLSAEEQESVAHDVNILRQQGMALRFPRCSGVSSSKHRRMRELRIQHQGRPYRVLYAFDPNRAAVLLIGGDKTGKNRWYEIFVPIADRLLASTSQTWSRTMAKARNFKELEAKMRPEARERVAARVKETLDNMSLDQLRAARELTQEHLAELLHIKQASVSKMEHRTDMYIGTLSKFIEAMGGQLEIRAVFPDGSVRITQFSQER